MSGERVNSSPLSAREGKVFIDNIEVADCCKFKVTFTPDVWEGKSLGKKATSRRWLGYKAKAVLEEWKTNRRFTEIVKQYIADGKTPEMTMTGISNDENSDYWDVNGEEDTVTCAGCVPTGDIDLLDLDTEGDVVKQSVEFGVYEVM